MRHIRVISVFLSVLLLFSMLPLAASAEDAPTVLYSYGATDVGANLTMKIYSDNRVVVSGSGTTLKNYSSYSSRPWYTNYSASKKWVQVTSVEFDTPNLQTVGNYFFNGMTALENVSLPETVTTIGYYAFQSCPNIQNFYFPESVTSIDVGVFKDSAIMNLYIDNVASICAIHHNGTYNTTNYRDQNPWGHAQNVYVKNTETDPPAFVLTEDLVIPESITEIPDLVFGGAPFKTVAFHAGVTSIGNYSFTHCENLVSIFFAQDGALTSIGSYAFYQNSSLTEVDLPGSVSSLGDHAFFECTSLAHVVIEEGSLTTLSPYCFADSGSLLVFECWPTLTTAQENATRGGRELNASHGVVYYNGVHLNGTELRSEIAKDGDEGAGSILTYYYDWFYLQSVTVRHYMMDTDGVYQLSDTVTKNRVAGKGIEPASFAVAPEGLRYDHFEQTGLTESDGAYLVPENNDAVIDLYYARNQYQIGFQDKNGDVLQAAEPVYHGATPEFHGERNAFDEGLYTYTPDGWTPAVGPAAGNVTYTAAYTRDYTAAVSNAMTAAQGVVDAPAGYDAAYVAGLADALAKLADLKDSEDADDEAAKAAAYAAIIAAPVYAEAGASYQITLVLNGGSYNGSTADHVIVLHEGDAALTLPTTATRDGYTFNGWRNDADEPVETVDPATLSGDITLTARWKRSDAAIEQTLHNAETLITDANDEFCDDLSVALQPLADALKTERGRSPRDEAAVESLMTQIQTILADKDAYRHDWGEWVLIEAASEGVDGCEERTCRRHGETQQRAVPFVVARNREFRFFSMQRMDYVLALPDGSDYMIYNSDPFVWYSAEPLQFSVLTYETFAYETYVVYVNGTPTEPDENGLYTIPQGDDPVIVTIAGAGYLPDTGEKISIWQLLVNFIRSVLAFFRSAFGR